MTSAVSVLPARSEEHTSELQSRENLVCRLPLEKKKKTTQATRPQQIKQTHRQAEYVGAAIPVGAGHPFCGGVRPPDGRGNVLFFLNDTATTEIYTLSLHDALPI